MDRHESIQISAQIGAYITEHTPTVKYTEADVKRALAEFADELDEIREIGMCGDDFEEFFVIREFCVQSGLSESADGEYLLHLFNEARRLDADKFERDPYLRTIRIPEKRDGNILLTNVEYAQGEIFQYDMPDFSQRLVVPKLGFFSRSVRFPAVYEGDMPWVSVCPSEINSMKPDIGRASGRVLVLGLGLGYYTFAVSELDSVEEITVAELNPRIINLFEKYILPQFPNRNKIRVVETDAVEYLARLSGGEYDFCYADIWEGAVDGAAAYLKIKPHEQRLRETEFAYWIEPQIRAYLNL